MIDLMFCQRLHAYLVPRMSFYLWKPKLSIAWVHATYFLSSWRTKNLEEHDKIKVNKI
jgi:hypothetical protein